MGLDGGQEELIVTRQVFFSSRCCMEVVINEYRELMTHKLLQLSSQIRAESTSESVLSTSAEF